MASGNSCIPDQRDYDLRWTTAKQREALLSSPAFRAGFLRMASEPGPPKSTGTVPKAHAGTC
eukprot:3577455-Alexandrium_andersonii.AAC.1